MSACSKCVYAVWHRTRNGRLHPSGKGDCTYDWVCPPLPKVMYLLPHEIKPHKVSINRHYMQDRIKCPCFHLRISYRKAVKRLFA